VRSYRVQVAVDGHSWTSSTDDPTPTPGPGQTVADLLPPGGILEDGLQVTRKLPDSEVWPCQPDPALLTFTVAAATARELTTRLRVGRAVAAVIGKRVDPADPASLVWPLETFTGRITSVKVTSSRGYAVAQVQAVDWLATLQEVQLPDTTAPLQSAQDRLSYVLGLVAAEAPELAGEGWTYRSGDGGILAPPAGGHTPLAERALDGLTALQAVRETLASWPVVPPFGNPLAGQVGRYVLSPHHGPGAATNDATTLLSLAGWRVDFRSAASTVAPPAELADLGDVWGVEFPPYSGVQGRVPARYVEVPAEWDQRIGQVPNVATVRTTFTGYRKGIITWRYALAMMRFRPRVRVKVDAVIEYGASADATYLGGVMATYYLSTLLIPTAPQGPNRWTPGEFTWNLAAMPDAPEVVAAAWLPTGFTAVTSSSALGRVVVVDGMDPRHNPKGAGAVAGLVESYTAKMSGGGPVVTFALRPETRDRVSADAMTYAQLPAGVTYADLDPGLEYDDLRLLRNPAL